jgi:hypothetical protein
MRFLGSYEGSEFWRYLEFRFELGFWSFFKF